MHTTLLPHLDLLASAPCDEAPPLLFAAALLAAMDAGIVPLHADDYRLIVLWARAGFVRMDVAQLRSSLADGLGSLESTVENELYVRAERQWTTGEADHRMAELAWLRLHERWRSTGTDKPGD